MDMHRRRRPRRRRRSSSVVVARAATGLGLPYAIAGGSPLDTAGVKVYLLCLMACIVAFVGLCVAPMYTKLPWWLGGTAAVGGARASSPFLTKHSAWLLCGARAHRAALPSQPHALCPPRVA
jgi:hypothetical protein